MIYGDIQRKKDKYEVTITEIAGGEYLWSISQIVGSIAEGKREGEQIASRRGSLPEDIKWKE